MADAWTDFETWLTDADASDIEKEWFRTEGFTTKDALSGLLETDFPRGWSTGRKRHFVVRALRLNPPPGESSQQRKDNLWESFVNFGILFESYLILFVILCDFGQLLRSLVSSLGISSKSRSIFVLFFFNLRE